MDIRPLHTEDDYRAALAEVSMLVDQSPERGTPEGDRLEILSILVEHYERSMETAHLLRSPANAVHLERSLAQLQAAGDAAKPRAGWGKASKAIADELDPEQGLAEARVGLDADIKEFADDILKMRMSLGEQGRCYTDRDLAFAWTRYSDRVCASWLELPDDAIELAKALRQYLPEPRDSLPEPRESQ
jgi:hypothetical protein